MLTRRDLLRGAAAAGCLAVLPRVMRASPVEVLSAPLDVTEGQTLVNKNYHLSPTFAWDSRNCAIRITGSNVTLRNVHVFSGHRDWSPSWIYNVLPSGSYSGVPNSMQGIALSGQRDGLVFEDVTVFGFPGVGFDIFGSSGSTFTRCRALQTQHGFILRPWGIHVGNLYQGCVARDQWEAPPPAGYPGGSVGYYTDRDLTPSRIHNGSTGGDGFVFNNLHSSRIVDCTAVGETHTGVKGGICFGVTFERFVSEHIHLDGTSGATPRSQVQVVDSMFDKALSYSTSIHGANALMLTLGIDLEVRNTVFRAAGKNGHGCQMNDAVNLDMRRCEISGFNQTQGSPPIDAHAVHKTAAATLNGDYLTANRFHDQTRKILVEGGGGGGGDACVFPETMPCVMQ